MYVRSFGKWFIRSNSSDFESQSESLLPDYVFVVMERSGVHVLLAESELEPGEIVQNGVGNYDNSHRSRRRACGLVFGCCCDGHMFGFRDEARRLSRSLVHRRDHRRARHDDGRRVGRSPSSASKSRHRREEHRRDKRTKRHKRHRSDAQREVDDAMEIDTIPVEEEEDIEKQREERRKRMAAIINKHQKRAEAEQKLPVMTEAEKSTESVSSAECVLDKGVAGGDIEKRSSPAEVERNVTSLKGFEHVEGSECSADRLAILDDEKHDKEKLLERQDSNHPHNHHPLAHRPQQDIDDIFCETPDNAHTNETYQSLDKAVQKAVRYRAEVRRSVAML